MQRVMRLSCNERSERHIRHKLSFIDSFIDCESSQEQVTVNSVLTEFLGIFYSLF